MGLGLDLDLGALGDPHLLALGAPKTCIPHAPTSFAYPRAGYTDGMMAVPGADLIEAGLSDLDCGVESIAALLVSIGAPRLRRLGFVITSPLPDPERALYRLLAEQDADAAHSRYNALIRRLVSFERATSCAT